MGAPHAGPTRERLRNALSRRQALSTCIRKPLQILALEPTPATALAHALDRKLVGRTARNRSLTSPNVTLAATVLSFLRMTAGGRHRLFGDRAGLTRGTQQ